MASWKEIMQKIAGNADDSFDRLKTGLKNRMELDRPMHILLYDMYGTREKFHVKGRVMEDKNIASAADNDTVWDNLLNTYKRMNSTEVAGAEIRLSFHQTSLTLKTDKEGYFETTLDVRGEQAFIGNANFVEAELLSTPLKTKAEFGEVKSRGLVYVPSANAKIAVISDIDDTIIETGATDLLKLARLTFMENAKTRTAFAGVGSLYQGLQEGAAHDMFNPFFYVSSSPWNLYDLLHDFIKLNKIPQGPMLLRDYGIDEDKMLFGTHGTHKKSHIEKIILTYPELMFVLIGDTGQEDTFIYNDIARQFPGRIAAIYIRDAKVEKQEARVQKSVREAKADGIHILVKQDSLAAAQDAFAKGWVSEATVKKTEEEVNSELQDYEVI